MGDEPLDSSESLTDRELEILRLIADGLTNQEIGDQLFLTVETVKWYNKQSYQKLGVHSRTQAIARVRELGMSAGAAQPSKNNLPLQSTAFIGREPELAAIRARLADPACRLLTLVGPGGIGKTRLAIEAAQQQQADFPDGVYFVPLASIESSTFIPNVLADALNLVQTRQQDPLAQIINVLRERVVLLVIDNFEHLLDGTALLAELLMKCRRARLLVTSRQRLHLKEEWLFDVPGLRCAAADSLPQSIVDLRQYEATWLFLQTAMRVRPDFSPGPDDAIHVAHICQLVGGMPLGIELSASWVRVLPCGEIAREIERGLDILKTAWRDVPERHQSIRAVLDQSWKLLSETEQNVFARMTVFSGSFSRTAAEEVAQATLTTLIDLVDKSFLKRTVSDRFVVHELLKQYGNDQLRRSDDGWMQTLMKHCRYYAALLYEWMQTPDVSTHLDEIEREFDEIQAAWRCAIAHKKLNEIRALAMGFLVYYGLRSWYRAGSDASELYRRALQCFEPATDDSAHKSTIACLYESLGNLYELARVNEDAMDAYEHALEYTDATDYITRGRLLGKTADVWVMMVQHEKADDVYTQAESVLDRATERSRAWWFEWTHIQLKRMDLYYWENRVDNMIALERRIRPMLDQHTLPVHRPHYMRALAMMALRRDRYFISHDAVAYMTQALALSLETGDVNSIALSHFQCGFCYLWADHLEEAEKHLQIAKAMGEQNGDLTILTRALTYLTVVHRKRGDTESVWDYAESSLKFAREAHMPQYTGMAHAQYAWLAWREGDVAKTTYHARMAIEDWGGLGEGQSVVTFRWFVLFPLLGVALQQKDLTSAVTWSKHLLPPPQQRLPDDLTGLLEEGISAWGQGYSERASDLLRRAFQRAQELCYV